jgi:hypothetical protein
MQVTGRASATAAITESNMGRDQLPRKGKRGLLSLVFSAASNNVRCFDRVLMSVGIVEGKGVRKLN